MGGALLTNSFHLPLAGHCHGNWGVLGSEGNKGGGRTRTSLGGQGSRIRGSSTESRPSHYCAPFLHPPPQAKAVSSSFLPPLCSGFHLISS